MTFVNYSAQQRHCLDGVHFWGFSHNASVSEWSTLRGRGQIEGGGKMFGTRSPLYCSAAFANNSLMSCQSSYVHTCPVGCLPWVAVDEELDILRRSRSEITESLSSSSARELEDGVGGNVEEGVGRAHFVCDVIGRWCCKMPVQLAENLLLFRRRCEAGRNWGWEFEIEAPVERGSVGVIIGAFLSSTSSRGCWLSLLRLNEPRERLRLFPLETVIGVWEGYTANNIRKRASMVAARERERRKRRSEQICKCHRRSPARLVRSKCQLSSSFPLLPMSAGRVSVTSHHPVLDRESRPFHLPTLILGGLQPTAQAAPCDTDGVKLVWRNIS